MRPAVRRTATNIGILRARRSRALPRGIAIQIKFYASRTDTVKALHLYIAGQRGAKTKSRRIAVSVIMHSTVSGPTPVIVVREHRTVIGTPQVVKDGVEAIAAEYGGDEALILDIVCDHSARKRSYQLIADAFGLVGA